MYLVPRGLRLIAPRLLGRARRVLSYMAPIPGLRISERRACCPSHQPGAAWPIYAYDITQATQLETSCPSQQSAAPEVES